MQQIASQVIPIAAASGSAQARILANATSNVPVVGGIMSKGYGALAGAAGLVSGLLGGGQYGGLFAKRNDNTTQRIAAQTRLFNMANVQGLLAGILGKTKKTQEGNAQSANYFLYGMIGVALLAVILIFKLRRK